MTQLTEQIQRVQGISKFRPNLQAKQLAGAVLVL